MCVSQYFFLKNSKIASGNVRCACNVELFSYNQCHISNISVISGEFKTQCEKPRCFYTTFFKDIY